MSGALAPSSEASRHRAQRARSEFNFYEVGDFEGAHSSVLPGYNISRAACAVPSSFTPARASSDGRFCPVRAFRRRFPALG